LRRSDLPIGKRGKGVGGVRALDCSCGQHLEADNDEELFKRAREHVDTDHPEMKFSDEKVRHIVDRGAYEK
jgi:predicted small metal-binding protein